MQRLASLAADQGAGLNINSGRRSYGEQLALWNAAPEADRGVMVAQPGTSRHESGIAADVNSDWFQGLANDVLSKYGLEKPMDYEPWHVQLA
jgi:LAS superfamily LD-carboxypeptidase LdcB